MPQPVYDRQAILAHAVHTNNAQELADATGYELNGSFRSRIHWLVTKDEVLDEKFLSLNSDR